MYFDRDKRVFLPVSQETWDALWLAVNDKEPDNIGFKFLSIGDVVIVVDSTDFRKWVSSK